jgi:hypothetical protein
MLDAATLTAIAKIAKGRGWAPAALAAIVEVESGGTVFAAVNGRQEPLIRFEGHYFDRRLSGAAQAKARALGLASPIAGKIANPPSQAARWKMLDRAAEIDANAAFESCSWGVGQVMGAHWAWLGFQSVTALVNLCRSGADGQVELMARYIEKAGLADALKRKDWAGFARGYNGPAYAKNRYDTNMAAAFARWSARLGAGAPAPAPAEGMLRLGSKGAEVRELQTLLVRAGHAVAVDGDYGPATRDAVKMFQVGHGLAADGVAGPATRAALDRWRQGAAETPTIATKVGATLVKTVLERKLGASVGQAGGDLAETVIKTIAEKAGVEPDALPDVPQPQLEEAVVATEAAMPELIALWQAGLQGQFALLMAEEQGSSLHSGWRWGWMYFLGLTWFCVWLGFPIANAFGMGIVPPELAPLMTVTGWFIGLYMGGHTLKELGKNALDAVRAWRDRPERERAA